MRALSAVAGRIDAFQDAVGRGVAWLSFLMVAVVTTDVIMRYLFRISFVFVQELEWHLFAALYLLAAGYTLLHDDLVRVDIVYSRLSSRAKAWLDFILTLIFLSPACLLMLHTTWPFVLSFLGGPRGFSRPRGPSRPLRAESRHHGGLCAPGPPGGLSRHQELPDRHRASTA